jgi:hypothetical protein
MVRQTMKLPLLALSVSASTAFSAVNFEKEVWPFLQKKCVECHAASKVVDGRKKEPKGGLRMDAAFALMAGGKNGAVVKPKSADTSRLYEVVTLAKDDDDFMPPKGEALSDAEVKLLKQWIDEGADFGGWEGNAEGKPVTAGAVARGPRAHEELYKVLSDGLKEAPKAALDAAKAAGAQVSVVGPVSQLVRVDFLTGVSACTDEKVAALLPLADYIAQLDLGRTKVSDAAMVTVAKFPKLVKLDLRQTAVTDAGLESLTALKHLTAVNAFGTPITDAGVKTLAGVKSLRQLTAFETKATEAGAKAAKAVNAELTVVVK